MDDNEKLAVAHNVLQYVEKVLNATTPPQLPEDFAEDEAFKLFHEKMLALREAMLSFARGDLSSSIKQKGIIGGSCKALQSNLRHITWKVQQVEIGDFSQRVDFLGDFSTAFNQMASQLDASVKALHVKEEALTSLAISLQEEAKRRSATLEQLRKSEAEYKYLAQHDPLTGTLNRRFFFSLAETKLESCRTLHYDSCLCLLDVDFFKAFNDKYGHQEGDRALNHVVEQSRHALRASDIMGRYGGEEFIFFFTSASLDMGRSIAERIRKSIAETPLVLSDGTSVTLQASLGVACIPGDWSDEHSCQRLLEHAVGLADVALYQSKRQGRNKVSIAPTQPL